MLFSSIYGDESLQETEDGRLVWVDKSGEILAEAGRYVEE